MSARHDHSAALTLVGVMATSAFVVSANVGAANEVAGDPVAGEQVYGRCMACHALNRDRTGPRHCGLLGRRAGTVPGFTYSEAMRTSSITWTPATLDRFLSDPMGTVPGTTMTYRGIPDDTERANLIAWLVLANQDEQRCPTPPPGAATP